MAEVKLAAFQLSCNHIRRVNVDMRVEEGDTLACYECPKKPITHYPAQRTAQLRLE